MRTTVTLTDDVYKAAKSLAAAEGISLGQALSLLVRTGLQSRIPICDGAFPTFEVGPDDPTVTPEQIKEALDDW